MPTHVVIGGVALAAVVGAGAYVTMNRVEICHATGSEKKPWKVIKVSERSWAAHEAHGDIYPVPVGGCDAPTDGGGSGDGSGDGTTPPPPPGSEF